MIDNYYITIDNDYTTSVMHLALEDFYNAGISPEQAKNVIESIRDRAGTLRCEASGINNNWNVHTVCCHRDSIKEIVWQIEDCLNELLAKTQHDLPAETQHD